MEKRKINGMDDQQGLNLQRMFSRLSVPAIRTRVRHVTRPNCLRHVMQKRSRRQKRLVGSERTSGGKPKCATFTSGGAPQINLCAHKEKNKVLVLDEPRGARFVIWSEPVSKIEQTSQLSLSS